MTKGREIDFVENCMSESTSYFSFYIIYKKGKKSSSPKNNKRIISVGVKKIIRSEFSADFEIPYQMNMTQL